MKLGKPQKFQLLYLYIKTILICIKWGHESWNL